MKNASLKALIVTATRVHFAVAKPIIDELRKKGWQVVVLHLEGIWQRAKGFSMKRKRGSLMSFRVGAARAR